jgi:hypothetical protein
LLIIVAGNIPAVIAQKLGAPDEPPQFPKMVSAAALESVNDRAGVDVGFVTLVVKSGDRAPALKVLTEPPDVALIVIPVDAGVRVILLPAIRTGLE